MRTINASFWGYKVSRLLAKCIAVHILLLHSFADTYAQNASLYAVQAAYVYHFTKFVTWPESSFDNHQTPFRICILDTNDTQEYFEPLSGRTTEQRLINIIYDFDISNIQHCHILVITGRPTRSTLIPILAETNNHPVLTVGDSKDFVRYGGMIGFLVEGGRVRLDINLDAVNNSGLSMSAKLLEVARSVLSRNGD